MDGSTPVARTARRGIALAIVLFSAAFALPAAASAQPFVRVDDVVLTKSDDGGRIDADITWDRGAADTYEMGEGDVRAVAVSRDGHLPTLLATRHVDDVTTAEKHVVLAFSGDALRKAVQDGNRVVLTATQHPEAGGLATTRSYVTVVSAQRFVTPQDRIGRRDCSDVAITPGADLSRCDLVGAHLDQAEVAERSEPYDTRMLLADLTGATLRSAVLTGASIAGGRVNGADMSNATIDNLSLAGAEGTGLIARGSKSAVGAHSVGANIFAASMERADFSGSTWVNVSLGRSDLDGAKFTGGTFGIDGGQVSDGLEAAATSLRGADLSAIRIFGPTFAAADLTDATYLPAAQQPLVGILDPALLCHTKTPLGQVDRDCPDNPDHKPAANPLITVDGRLDRQDGRVTIRGTVRWNAGARSTGMQAGHVRVLAVDRATGRATVILERALGSLDATTTIPATTITDAKKLRALEKGNRVVISATQHWPTPDTDLTRSSYVAVDMIQAGPGRGRVGATDCSDRPLVPGSPALAGCDLVGAWLEQADLAGSPLSFADLSGAVLTGASVRGDKFQDAALGSVQARRANFGSVDLLMANAPGIDLRNATVFGVLRARSLVGANFDGATISSSTFAGTPMRNASFVGTAFTGTTAVDLGYADLRGAKIQPSAVTAPTSLFLADLTGATLRGTLSEAAWPDDEAGDRPWRWALKCHTTMADGQVVDEDCPRVPTR